MFTNVRGKFSVPPAVSIAEIEQNKDKYLEASYICGGKRTIATIGLDNIVIVDSDDALLVAAKGKIQDVKKVAEEIKGRGE